MRKISFKKVARPVIKVDTDFRTYPDVLDFFIMSTDLDNKELRSLLMDIGFDSLDICDNERSDYTGCVSMAGGNLLNLRDKFCSVNGLRELHQTLSTVMNTITKLEQLPFTVDIEVFLYA